MLAGLNHSGRGMNVGKTLFAQGMELVPRTTFGRIVERHNGDAGVRTLGCADLFRAMAFAQLAWRESLRDIEARLAANQAKLLHMGIKALQALSTLSDALNQRDRRIHHALAQRLIARARALSAQEPSVLELDASVYALDATTIDLCLSLFEWAPFRSGLGAIELPSLLDLRVAIPASIHIGDGKPHDVNVLDIRPIEARAFYAMGRGYVDFARLYTMHQAGAFFVTRAKRGMDARRVYSAPAGSRQRRDLRSAHRLQRHLRGQELSGASATHSLQGPRVGQDAGVLDRQHPPAGVDDGALYKSRWQVELFYKRIKQHLRIKRFLGTSENAVKT